VKTVNAKRLSALVRKLATVPSKASSKIAQDLNREIQRNFSAGVDPFGRKWKKLAPATLEGGRHPPPLTDTHAGRKSVTVKPMRGAGVMIVVGLLYMIYHQFGGASHLRGPGKTARARYANRKKHKHFGRDEDRSKGRARPPRRSFLPQGDEWPKRWVTIIERAYDAASKKVWRG
jgi:phage gpG-like protein